MKILCLSLLLANVLFFGWSHWIVPRNMPSAAAPAQSIPKLVLASEVSAANSAAEAAPQTEDRESGQVAATDLQSAQLESGANGMRCVSLGPFQEISVATQAASSLRGKGYESRTRVMEGDVRAGVWVHLENLAPADAQRAMTGLKQHGIADAYLMPSEDRGAAEISLGIFSEPARAQRRAEEVRAIGLKPTITDRRKGASYWLDIELKPGDNPIDPAVIQNGEDKSGKIMRLDVIACPKQP